MIKFQDIKRLFFDLITSSQGFESSRAALLVNELRDEIC